jgi:hypothetical protein
MTPNDIYKALAEIRDKFPKSSKMYVFLIEQAGATGAFEGATQRGALISMKSAWKLEEKAPTRTFSPTDESVIGYVRGIAENASQSAVQMLVAIELNKGLTSVWVQPKGMCFIATAAYGSPLASEVLVLSRFRDDVLLRSKLGRSAVRLYYAISPPVASSIDESQRLKMVIRKMLVPILFLVRKLMQRER